MKVHEHTILVLVVVFVPPEHEVAHPQVPMANRSKSKRQQWFGELLPPPHDPSQAEILFTPLKRQDVIGQLSVTVDNEKKMLIRIQQN